MQTVKSAPNHITNVWNNLTEGNGGGRRGGGADLSNIGMSELYKMKGKRTVL